MKVSAAAVLLSCSTASAAFNVGYLNQLGGSSAPAKLAPEPKAVVTGGPASYLDNLGAGTPELVNAIADAVPPTPAPPAPVAVSSSPNTGSYLSNLGGGSAAPSGGGLTGYLDALPSASTQTSGSGMTSYLDTMGGSAPAAPAPAAPVAAAPVAAAPAPVAAAPVATVDAPSAGDYLSTLASATSLSGGAGMATYLESLPAASTQTTGAGLPSYLDVLGAGATQTSGAGLAGYLDALASNTAIAGPASVAAPSSPSVSAFLDSVYKQILALPEDGSKKVSGNSLTFASANGPYAMSFVKN